MAIGADFLTLVAGNSELRVFQNGQKIWNTSVNNLNPIALEYDKTTGHFLILTEDAN